MSNKVMRIARRTSSAIATGTMLLVLVLVSPPSASADDPLPANCPDGVQIGNSAYADWNGIRVATVKQYYSARCRANWSYVYIWESFRSRGYGWTTEAWISANPTTTDPDGEDFGWVARENWIHTYSVPAGTTTVCSRAGTVVAIYSSRDHRQLLGFAPVRGHAYTGWRC